MSETWQAILFLGACVCAVVAIVVAPPDRPRQPVVWLCGWALLVAIVWFAIAFDAATA